MQYENNMYSIHPLFVKFLFTMYVCMYSFIPLLYMVTIVSNKKYHAAFRTFRFFLTKKRSLIFEIQKNGWPHIIICSKDSKKVNIFEISSLKVYYRGVGFPGSTLYCILTFLYLCMYIYVPFLVRSYVFIGRLIFLFFQIHSVKNG